jgi:hypothetical protein
MSIMGDHWAPFLTGNILDIAHVVNNCAITEQE